jgi:putative ABC transport system permease protein
MGWIAVRTLVADRGKLATALVGLVFSLVLVNVQGGLFLGLLGKASLLVDRAGADIWVGHKAMHNVDFPHAIPSRWVARLRSLPGVQRAEPYTIGWATMTLPSGGFEPVVVVGSDPASLLGSAWNIREGSPGALRHNDGIVVDECDDHKLEHPAVGDLREIGGRKARVVAKSRGIVGFLISPYVFTTLDRAAEYLRLPHGVCSYYLVQVKPGFSVDEVSQAIRHRTPQLDVYARHEYARISIQFWMTRTGLGISFGAATLLGLAVGLVMVAQTLYASVLDRLGEFGTLKALGAEEWQVYQILLTQALALAGGGSLIGLVAVAAIRHWFHSYRAPIVIPLWLSLGSCLLLLAIALVSSLLPYLRVRRLDPVMVLQG